MDYQPIVPPSESAPEPSTAPLTPAQPTPSMVQGMPTMPMVTSSGSGGGPSKIMIILIVLLGLGAMGFGIMAIMFYSQDQQVIRKADSVKAQAVQAAEKVQKTADDVAYAKASETPFRAYTSPVADGSFVINFPKNWSGWVDEETSGNNVNLILNPDFVRMSGGVNSLAGCVVKLVQQQSTQYMSQFASYIQQGQMHQAGITVSGIQGFDLTGQFSDNRTTRMVVVPVRDKVLVFTNENAKYSTEFNEILAQAKVNP